MTKLLLCSDLHTNFHKDEGVSAIDSLYDKDVDIAVIAGDLTIVMNDLLRKNITQLCNKFPQVVYVPGNHEYFHSSFYEVESILEELTNKFINFTWLNNTRKIVSGVPFVGATLWYANGRQVQSLKRNFSDFIYINGFEPEVFERHEKTIDFFDKNIQAGDVVVTHHMPTHKSVSNKFINSSYNCFFVSDLDDIIKNRKPALILHGHTHSLCDYLHYDSRIACNPMGYLGENTNFLDSFIIEV